MENARRGRGSGSLTHAEADPGTKAFVGICYPSRRLFRNASRLFMPASTTKLYTSWLACEALGEDFVFRSEYAVKGRTLFLSPMGNPLLSEDSFTDLLGDLGGRQIEEVVLVPFLGASRYPATWAIGDVREAWGAPISDVCFHENYVTVDGSEDASVAPSSSFYTVRVAKGLERPEVRGRTISLPAGFVGRFEFPITNPEAFLVHWLGERLSVPMPRMRRGRLRGTPVPFAHAPLRDVLRSMNKRSVNLLAELLLRHASRALGKPVEDEQPQPGFDEVLRPIGVDDARLYDGSGVSRYNLVSPSGTVALLEASTKYPSITDSLPIGGKDGTLADRRLPPRIHAKTGSLTGVQALAGYDGGKPFSIVINHGPADERAMIDAIDHIVVGR